MTAADSETDLPAGLLVAWYGDDLTGSAAVMEVLALAGLPSVLFLGIPTDDQVAAHGDVRGIGIAGTARRQSVEWMCVNLPPIFDFLAGTGAPIAHYKICSTLDSSPQIGSIGAALDLAIPRFETEWTPLVVAAPPIGRYQVFGNLFADANGVTHRLDRHPTMSVHPVTPMLESDVRRHLGFQTAKPIGLVDVVALDSGDANRALASEIESGATIVAIDVARTAHLSAVGGLIWDNRGDGLLAAGSQSVEYALIDYWRQRGWLRGQAVSAPLLKAEVFAGVSGSLSPITASQLEWAADHGFELVRIDTGTVSDDAAWRTELDRVVSIALEWIGMGNPPIVYSPQPTSDSNEADASDRIGLGIGHVANRLVTEGRLTRLAVAGGDTSGYVIEALGVGSLAHLGTLDHGTSVFETDLATDRGGVLEVSLKGGQMGPPDFFWQISGSNEAIAKGIE